MLSCILVLKIKHFSQERCFCLPRIKIKVERLKKELICIIITKYMVLFFVGVLEMIIITVWTKLVVKTRIFASGAITLVNVLIWYYVLQTVVDNISNWRLVLLYALGCAVGTIISTYYFHRDENSKSKLAKQE